MADTLMSDFAAALDSFVGGRVWAGDRVPSNPSFPYIGVWLDPFPSGPAHDGDVRTLAWATLVQIDVWQLAADEDVTLARSVRSAVNGLKLTSPRLRARVQQSVRAPEESPSNIVHDAITVRVAEAE
jgi:hypothetical protein